MCYTGRFIRCFCFLFLLDIQKNKTYYITYTYLAGNLQNLLKVILLYIYVIYKVKVLKKIYKIKQKCLQRKLFAFHRNRFWLECSFFVHIFSEKNKDLFLTFHFVLIKLKLMTMFVIFFCV